MGKQNMHKKDIFYKIVKGSIKLSHRLFFKKIYVLNRQNIPKGESVIVTPNHQNALLDSFSIGFTMTRNRDLSFLARADIFKNKLAARFLYFLKMLPVFRIRDGVESLGKNEEIFQLTVDIIRKKLPLVIHPEGNHSGIRRVRPLKKGFARIAFRTLEESDFKEKLYVMPVGLEYDHFYQKAQQNLIVNYGELILVNDYEDIYKEDPARAMKLLLDKVKVEIAKLMINIKSVDYYDLYEQLRESTYREVIRKDEKSDFKQPHKMFAQQKLISALDEAQEEKKESFESLKIKSEKYISILKELNLRDWIFERHKYSSLGIIAEIILATLLSPIALYGLLFCGIPMYLPNKIVKNFKDLQFHGTVNFVLGLFISLFLHLILLIVSLFIFDNNWYVIPFWISMVISCMVLMRYPIRWRKISAKIRYNRLSKRSDKRLLEAQNIRKEFNSFVSDLI